MNNEDKKKFIWTNEWQKELDDTMNELLHRFGVELKASHIEKTNETEYDLVKEFIEVGEAGLAYEEMVNLVMKRKLRITNDEYKLFEKAHALMSNGLIDSQILKQFISGK